MSLPAQKTRIKSAQQRKFAVEQVLKDKRSVSGVARELGVARKTIYQWIQRYQKSVEQDIAGPVAFENAYVKGETHPRAIYPQLQDKLLDMVAKQPELSVHRLANRLPASSWTVWSMLDRNNLNRYEQRLAYSKTQEVAPKPVFARFLDRARYVLERFVPSLAPAPPPERHERFFSVLKTFSVSVLTSFLFGFGIPSWIRLISQAATTSSAIGLVFASIAFLMGSLFFLYSLKYYLTLAVVLSFSQTESANNIEQRTKGRGRGFLSSILGFNGRSPTSPEDVRGKAVGLTPNLEHVRLKRKPYVSIHIPFYNEENVVERSIAAATSFDYPEYEVILCDDSTDETVDIIRNYQKKHLAKGERLKIVRNKKEGWTLTTVEVRPGVTLKHIHRTSRSGFKGGALSLALSLTDPKAEFISVFDADFVPYPDTLELFLKYFQATTGTLDFRKVTKKKDSATSNIAAVQGYQWHVLNKSENWITRGIRSEYAGSYVIERSGTEIYQGLKMISGAVYMIRRDVLEEVGWETSITEDFQLTLKLYEKGYKVVYTPYIQAPAECVSTLGRLIRQRMRWAEGHSNNIRKMFLRLMVGKWEMRSEKWEVDSEPGSGKGKSQLPLLTSRPTSHHPPSKVFIPSPLTLSEKLEFLYLSPYYLQAFFFLVGTISWLISETVFPARLPFWTSLWGWSLVFTNMFSLPLMNAVGLFLEESEEKDYSGLASFIALSYIMVPFQAYSSLKGFLKGEGPWFRTPKTGRITDVLKRGTFYRFISGILPGRAAQAPIAADLSRLAPIPASINQPLASWRISVNPYVALATANNTSTRLSAFSTFNSFSLKPKKIRWLGKVIMVFVLTASLLVHSMAFKVQPAQAWWGESWQYRFKYTIDNSNVGETLTDFPLHIDLTNDAPANFWTNVSSETGNDIRIVDEDDTTDLSSQAHLEGFSKASSKGHIWVKRTITANVSTEYVWIYYGNSGASSPFSDTTKQATYNSGYKGVWHFDNSVSDSTANDNDGTNYGATAVSDGKIGGAHDFEISESDYIQLPENGSLDLTGYWTMSAWVKVESTNTDKAIFHKGLDPNQNYYFGIVNDEIEGNFANGSWRWIQTTNQNLNTTTWYYVVFSWDDPNNYQRLYNQGTEDQDVSPRTETTSPNTTDAAATIGAWYSGGPLGVFDGLIDEVRVSSTARSAEWIEFAYLSDKGDAGTAGSEEEVPEMVVLLLPVVLLVPLIVKHCRKKKEGLAFAKAY